MSWVELPCGEEQLQLLPPDQSAAGVKSDNLPLEQACIGHTLLNLPQPPR